MLVYWTLGKTLCAIYNHQSDAFFSPSFIRTIQMTFNNTNIASIDHVPFIMQYHRICVHFVFNNDNLVLGNTKTRSVCTFLWNTLVLYSNQPFKENRAFREVSWFAFYSEIFDIICVSLSHFGFLFKTWLERTFLGHFGLEFFGSFFGFFFSGIFSLFS